MRVDEFNSRDRELFSEIFGCREDKSPVWKHLMLTISRLCFAQALAS